MDSRDVAFWKEAVQSEIDSIMHNDTWELIDFPPGCKWILKRKMKVDGSIDKYKSRLVIQALAAIHELVIHQMNVKTTFLNGDLDEEICMKQHKGFVMAGHKSK
nr:zinc finger, CCHC-type [Tanacetum cinerariifolium]